MRGQLNQLSWIREFVCRCLVFYPWFVFWVWHLILFFWRKSLNVLGHLGLPGWFSCMCSDYPAKVQLRFEPAAGLGVLGQGMDVNHEVLGMLLSRFLKRFSNVWARLLDSLQRFERLVVWEAAPEELCVAEHGEHCKLMSNEGHRPSVKLDACGLGSYLESTLPGRIPAVVGDVAAVGARQMAFRKRLSTLQIATIFRTRSCRQRQLEAEGHGSDARVYSIFECFKKTKGNEKKRLEGRREKIDHNHEE